MDIGDLLSQEVLGVVDWAGKRVEFTFRPSAVTSKALAEYKVQTDEESNAFLAENIVSWDITTKKNGRDVMVPITSKTMEELPLPFIRKLMSAMVLGVMDLGEAESNSQDG